MRKVYQKPYIEDLGAEPTMLICDSVTSDKGIGYGGVDDDGELEPASRSQNTWDEEEL